MTQATFTPATYVWIPEINEYVEVVGAKSEIIGDKKILHIICEGYDGREILLRPAQLQAYFDACALFF
jgi:hypothetical protein